MRRAADPISDRAGDLADVGQAGRIADDDASGAAAATDGSGVRGVPDAAFEQASLGMGGRPPAAPPSPLAGSHPDALIANACNELMDWLGGCVHGTGAHTHTQRCTCLAVHLAAI